MRTGQEIQAMKALVLERKDELALRDFPVEEKLGPRDRVCMEPGIPDPASRATRLGKYNLDPAVRFWATPPIHGVLRPTVVHPADFTFKLPDNVSLAVAALVEPLVTGAGPIGLVTLLAARAAGCARVIVSDVDEAKLDLAKKLGAAVTVDARS